MGTDCSPIDFAVLVQFSHSQLYQALLLPIAHFNSNPASDSLFIDLILATNHGIPEEVSRGELVIVLVTVLFQHHLTRIDCSPECHFSGWAISLVIYHSIRG
jgi:hypothetical protein